MQADVSDYEYVGRCAEDGQEAETDCENDRKGLVRVGTMGRQRERERYIVICVRSTE